MQLYAIINTGGTEYRVSPGGSIKVDRLEAQPGAAIEFDSVSKLVNGDRVAEGKPLVKGALVRAHIKKHGQDNGVIVFKMGRRQLYKKKHDRQWQYTVLKIDEIVFEDSTFSKRDVDPRKIKKAQAAIAAKKPRAPKPAKPKPEPAPVAAPPVPTPVQPQPVVEQRTQAAHRTGKWPVIAALLLLLIGGAYWLASPSTPMTSEPTPAEIHLQQTGQVGRPISPTQPPD